MSADGAGPQAESSLAQVMGGDRETGRRPVALVADDEPLVLQLVCSVLARHGWRTIQATDGAQALGMSIDEQVDLLITDYQMPSITGLELAKTVRRRTPDLPILLISGRPDLDVVASNLGYSFLSKPFELAELMSLVGALVNEQDERQTSAPEEEREASGTGGMNDRGTYR